MSWPRPSFTQLRTAIELYLRLAYIEFPPPATVRTKVEGLPADEALFAQPAFEVQPTKDPDPTRYSLRLGNARYPHMKLVVERSPDGRGHLFRADTHDRHIRPREGSPEAAQFQALMEFNQQTAEKIEAAWARAGLMTFKSYLREDLARRAADNA